MSTDSKKRLYRNTDDRKIAGVCSGIADYLDVDPTVIRLIWILLVCCAGVGVVAYIIAALIIPSDMKKYM